MAQTTYTTMFVWAVLTFLEQMAERRKKEHLAPLDLSAFPLVKIGLIFVNNLKLQFSNIMLKIPVLQKS